MDKLDNKHGTWSAGINKLPQSTNTAEPRVLQRSWCGRRPWWVPSLEPPVGTLSQLSHTRWSEALWFAFFPVTTPGYNLPSEGRVQEESVSL